MSRRLILAVALWPALAVAQAPAPATASAPVIISSGAAQVTLRPDRVTITVAVVERNTSPSHAGRANAERMRAVLNALRSIGVPDSLVATGGYSLSREEPPRDAQQRVTDAPVMNVARNSIRITLTQLDAIGRVVDAALEAGATEIGNITFSSTEMAAARRRAVALAVVDARADAEAAAEAAGGRLGALIELIIGQDFNGRGSAVMLRGPSAFSTPISAPSDISAGASVSTRFAFIPNR